MPIFYSRPFQTQLSQSHIFADDTARDAYFPTRLGELRTGLNIISAGTLQIWGGANTPGTYDNGAWITTGGSALTAAEIKSLYESNADTNAFTDSDDTKLTGVAAGAEVNVQADYTEANTGADDFITNKPNLTQDITGVSEPSPNILRFTRRDASTFDINVQQSFNPPVITSFSIQGQDANVDPGTTLAAGNRTFEYNVTNPTNVNGNLTLTQDASTLSTTIDPSQSSVVVAINAETLATAGNTVVFTLSGVDTAGTAIQRIFDVTAQGQDAYVYYGLSATNIPATIDVSTLTRRLAVSNDQFNIDITPTAGQFLNILAPTDHDVSTIFERNLNVDSTSIFTKSTNVRQLNSQNFNSYVLGPLTGGVENDYRVTIS